MPGVLAGFWKCLREVVIVQRFTAGGERSEMKKVKWIFWLLVIGFVGLIIFQNQGYFLDKQQLGIDVYFKQYQTPIFANGVLFLACFLIGFLLAYILSLSERFKSGRTIRKLNESIQDHLEQVAMLKREMDSIKAASVQTLEPVTVIEEESPLISEAEPAVPEEKESQE